MSSKGAVLNTPQILKPIEKSPATKVSVQQRFKSQLRYRCVAFKPLLLSVGYLLIVLFSNLYQYLKIAVHISYFTKTSCIRITSIQMHRRPRF